jgi:hypothetical protein
MQLAWAAAGAGIEAALAPATGTTHRRAMVQVASSAFDLRFIATAYIRGFRVG